jgi:RNA polymerase sigma-70 factor (ECF subfamily)
MFVQNRIWDEQDVEDLVQDTLMTINKKYKSIDSEANFAAWAYKVLKNNLLYYFRTRKYQSSRESDEIDGTDPPSPWHSDPLLETRIKDCLGKISRAKVRYVQVLDLHYQGYTVSEVCEKLNLTANALYIAISRARSLLKLCLEKGDIS